jgi:hypothetical protein
MNHEQSEKEIDQMALVEAERVLKLFPKSYALIFCEEIAKKLPSVNDTPPVKRLSYDNYRQFYLNRVSFIIRDKQ